LRLYLTEQVSDEFRRNREGKLRESLREFEKISASSSVPRFMESYASVAEFRRALDQLLKAKDEATQQAKKEADEGSLAADKLFKEIEAASETISRTNADLEKARIRMALGNPPGKQGSLGDSINWEILIRTVEDGADLHVISKDADFKSALSAAPNRFLADEWQSTKRGNLLLHDQLKPFLAEHFPDIKLAIDAEKKSAMDRLIGSPNFGTTHSAIIEFSPLIDTLTSAEIGELLQAVENNPQIGWIVFDPDVKEFYSRLLEKYKSGGSSDEELSSRIQDLLQPAADGANDDEWETM
jgi:PIN domain-containing protein